MLIIHDYFWSVNNLIWCLILISTFIFLSFVVIITYDHLHQLPPAASVGLLSHFHQNDRPPSTLIRSSSITLQITWSTTSAPSCGFCGPTQPAAEDQEVAAGEEKEQEPDQGRSSRESLNHQAVDEKITSIFCAASGCEERGAGRRWRTKYQSNQSPHSNSTSECCHHHIFCNRKKTKARKEKEPVYSLVAERGMPRRREFVMQVHLLSEKLH